MAKKILIIILILISVSNLYSDISGITKWRTPISFDNRLTEHGGLIILNDKIGNDTNWKILVEPMVNDAILTLEINQLGYYQLISDYNKKTCNASEITDSIFKIHLYEMQIHLINILLQEPSVLPGSDGRSEYTNYYFDVLIPNYFIKDIKTKDLETVHFEGSYSPKFIGDNRIRLKPGINKSIRKKIDFLNLPIVRDSLYNFVTYTKPDKLSFQKIRYKVTVYRPLNQNFKEIDFDTVQNCYKIVEDGYEIVGDTTEVIPGSIRLGNMSLGKLKGYNYTPQKNADFQIEFERYKRRPHDLSVKIKGTPIGKFGISFFDESGRRINRQSFRKEELIYSTDINFNEIYGRYTYVIYDEGKYELNNDLKNKIYESFFDAEELPIDSEKPGYK